MLWRSRLRTASRSRSRRPATRSAAGREQMPRLAGQREDYLFHSMKQFRDGSATGRDTIMAASLHGMSEEDLRDLAHYLSQLP